MTDDEELLNKAKIIAEATGRSEEQVLEDLLDDGIVNLSNEERKDKDLVQQLKEAAELITTVQSISQEVSENTVLNGGENKTEVKVETTLDGDVVDRAIDSLQRKADNIKKLALTLVPIFLLITGGSMEAFGIIDIMGSDDVDDSEYETVWGCTLADAENYNPDATDDDGSCWWDNGGGGGGGPPANCNWMWDDTSYTNDANPNSLYVMVSFSSPECPYEQEGDFEVHLILGGEHHDMEEEYIVKFFENYDLEFQFDDLVAGEYRLRLSFNSYDGSEYHWDSPRTYLFEDSVECSAFLQNQQGYSLESDPIKVKLSVDVAIPSEVGNACDSEQFEITWRLYSDNQVLYEEHTWEDGGISDTDRADYVEYVWENIDVGTYDSRIILKLNDEVIDEKWLSEQIIVEAEEDECEINLYDIRFSTNQTHAIVAYDLDCGYGEETGGYNVSIQFMVIGNESYEIGYQFNTTVHYITGYVEDIHILTLSNFTHENITHYDFAWFAIWGDENNPNYIERYWNNLPFTHPEPEPEPENCENLTITSNGITLGNTSNNLTMGWDLTHDGEASPSCFVEIELSITLYQNGTYLDISDFQKNGNYKIYTNGSIYVDSSMVDIFSELPQGTYEVLVKYRIVGDSEASQDYFANPVSLE